MPKGPNHDENLTVMSSWTRLRHICSPAGGSYRRIRYSSQEIHPTGTSPFGDYWCVPRDANNVADVNFVHGKGCFVALRMTRTLFSY